MEPVAMFDKNLDAYLENFLAPRPAPVMEMEAFAALHDFPIIGPHVGRLLAILSMSLRPNRVFEMGSGYGYSAWWFSLGLAPEGRIILTDGSEKNRDMASGYLSRLGIAERCDFRVGNALDILAAEKGPFDIIYNDIDKEQYPAAWEIAIDKLRPGGLFITDNLLWSGRVLDAAPDAAARGILDFTQKVRADERLFSSIVPMRDGLMIAVRKSRGE